MGKLERVPSKASKAHIRYRDKEGNIVPGVTTILNATINKPALIKWANQLGLQGFDSTAYVDETAKIGTLAHEMIQEHLGGNKVDYGAYSKDQISAAENSLLSYFEWERRLGKSIKTIHIELPLVSEMLKYGGTIDWYGMIGDEYWLIDIKTAKGLYPEHQYQVSAYYAMLLENDYKVDGVRLLRVGRSEDEGFDDHVVAKERLVQGFEVFCAARNLYKAKQRFEKGDN